MKRPQAWLARERSRVRVELAQGIARTERQLHDAAESLRQSERDGLPTQRLAALVDRLRCDLRGLLEQYIEHGGRDEHHGSGVGAADDGVGREAVEAGADATGRRGARTPNRGVARCTRDERKEEKCCRNISHENLSESECLSTRLWSSRLPTPIWTCALPARSRS